MEYQTISGELINFLREEFARDACLLHHSQLFSILIVLGAVE